LARLSFAYSTHAYAINHTVFDRLIEINESDNTIHNDISYNELIIPNGKSFVILPLLAGQRSDYSDIQKSVMTSNPVFLSRLASNLIKNRTTVKPIFLTFITPTLGRPSLVKTMNSIINQPDWNWESIVVFDGITPNYSSDNEHVHVIACEKKGQAGLVRNEAFPYVDTEWIAFVDDDDYIKPSYMDALKKYLRQQPDLDLVIFTYKDESSGNMQPPKGSGSNFSYCHVGISFAVRTEFIRKNNIQFRNIGCEDFYFLDDCRNAGAKFLVTHDLQYMVSRRSAWN